MSLSPSPPSGLPFTPVFSGHETFALRGTWLKKAYDLLQATPERFAHEEAFVWLGVGKNMAQSIRYWGRVCGIFDRLPNGAGYAITPLGHALLADDGWDPFLVTPASRWLLHWQLAARPETAFSWYYTFNLLQTGAFTADQLASQIAAEALRRGWRVSSPATLRRDVDCLLHCYVRPAAKELANAVEDALACPLRELNLIQLLPGERRYTLASSPQPDLPTTLILHAALRQVQAVGRQTLALHELAYAPGSPGRVFRLTEDGLLARLLRLSELTGGRAYFTEAAGIRQLAWLDPSDAPLLRQLLQQAFADEVAP